ncbi:MAG: glucokinase [Pseudomonadales bacterium]|nr:glucokinase [Pseudomonadales bacterium]MCP5182356.1 glucokinase [Pseudomonadales bacterium]
MTVLVADIGATNARFALADAQDRLVRTVVLSTRDMVTPQALLRDAFRALDCDGDLPERLCLAVAGPVRDGTARLTNQGEIFDQAALSRSFGRDVILVNDFVALAHAVPHAQSLEQIGGETADAGVKALIGPGSGCGMAFLVPQASGYVVFPSEGGHADLAPGSPLEAELWTALSARVPHVCWEAVLSGPGIENLHAALSEVWGAPAEPMSAARITEAGMDMADPICHQTLELFFGFLGAAAGGLAVTTLATGGVYIGGGIVRRMVEFARRSPLRRRFDERGMMADMVRRIPIYLILDDMPGLVGALKYLGQQYLGKQAPAR